VSVPRHTATGRCALSAVPVSEIVNVTVKPRSKKGPLVEVAEDGSLTVHVRERAIPGRATAVVTKAMADQLGLPKSQLELISGATSRVKRFRVS